MPIFLNIIRLVYCFLKQCTGNETNSRIFVGTVDKQRSTLHTVRCVVKVSGQTLRCAVPLHVIRYYIRPISASRIKILIKPSRSDFVFGLRLYKYLLRRHAVLYIYTSTVEIIEEKKKPRSVYCPYNILYDILFCHGLFAVKGIILLFLCRNLP